MYKSSIPQFHLLIIPIFFVLGDIFLFCFGYWKFLILFQNLRSQLVYTVLYDHNLLLDDQNLRSQLVYTILYDHNLLLDDQNLRSQLVYTVLYDHNLLLDLCRNQICVIWAQHWSFTDVNIMLNGMLDKHHCRSNFFFINFKGQFPLLVRK